MANPPPSSQQLPIARDRLLVPNQMLPQWPVRTTHFPTPVPAVDLQSPVYILASKGITENNKTDVSALVSAMETFGDFKWLKKLFHHSSNPCILGTQLTLGCGDQCLGLCSHRIISMHTLDGELHPIAFHSCTFTGAKPNYDVHNKELMAIF